MKTDINKLHERIELRNRIGLNNLPRNSGKTFILWHELAGIIEVEDFKTIVVGLPNNFGLCFLLPMLFDVFDEHEIKYEYVKQQNRIICGDKIIYFILSEEVKEKTCGFDDYYYQNVE